MKFEKIAIWKRSRDMAVSVYEETSGLSDFNFRDQMTRSCLSISSNIAEGLERRSRKEKSQPLSIATGSLAEFKSQVDSGTEIGYSNRQCENFWMNESEKIAAMLSSFVRKLHAG